MILLIDHIDGFRDQYFIDEEPTLVPAAKEPGALRFIPLDAASSRSRQPFSGETFYIPLCQIKVWTVRPNPEGIEPRPFPYAV